MYGRVSGVTRPDRWPPRPVSVESRPLVRMGFECDDGRVLARSLLGFLGWLGMLLLAIAAVVGLVILFAHGGGGGIDIDP